MNESITETADNFDIALWCATPVGTRYISFVDTLTDTVFQSYRDRGVNDRADLIISKEYRDAHPVDFQTYDPFDWFFCSRRHNPSHGSTTMTIVKNRSDSGT